METQEALEIVSYKLGLKLGSKALEDTVLLRETVQQAIADNSAGSPKAIDLRQYMQATKLVKLERLRLGKVAGEEFLANNLTKEGVLSTESGLQFRVIKQGCGPKPTAESSVTVDYQGQFIDGTIFESSATLGKPSTFLVNKVIRGWKEAIQHMQVGAEHEFFIPQHLAYGERGTESGIPPYATLIFRLKLISINH